MPKKTKRKLLNDLRFGQIENLGKKDIKRYLSPKEKGFALIDELHVDERSFDKKPSLLIGQKKINKEDLGKLSIYYPHGHLLKCINVTTGVLHRLLNTHLILPPTVRNFYDHKNYQRLVVGDIIEIRVINVTPKKRVLHGNHFIYEYHVVNVTDDNEEVILLEGFVKISPWNP